MVPDDQRARLSDGATPALRHEISWMLGRRSVAVKRLGQPAPSDDELQQILGVALTTPDHGALRPWRLVLCTSESRQRLAELFTIAKRHAHPDATEIDLMREREKALRPPVLLGLVAAPKPGIPKIPEIEQIASAGAALQSVLLAAHGLGYGAVMLSGSRCAAENVRDALGVERGETLLGFISIGTIVDTPRLASRPSISNVLRTFDGT